MFILIDNYDSFTWKLCHFLSDLGAEVDVVRNDAARVDEIMSRAPQGLILSPGPGMPQTAGISIDLIRVAAGKIPVLGVCLGHKALAVAFGGSLLRVDPPVHDKCQKLSAPTQTPFAPTCLPIARMIFQSHAIIR